MHPQGGTIMRSGLTLIALSALVSLPIHAGAATTCSDASPKPITSVPATSLKCQEAIAKAGGKFMKTKLKALAKCKLKFPASSCPSAADTLKIETTATKAALTISKACALDAAQDGLTSSYGDGTDDTVISSCALSQLNVATELVSWESHGATTEAWPGTGKERADCVKTISKAATLFLDKAHKNAIKCVASQMKLGTPGDLAPICVGSISGGSFVYPTDPKTAVNQQKLVAKIGGLLTSKCTAAETAGQIPTIFACPGATSVVDLANCVACGGLKATFEATSAEYSETGTYVAPGPAALQTAIATASPGDRILLGSGEYAEEALVSISDLEIVGCGGATDNRPRLVAPPVQVFGRGIRAFDVDDLLFQSLELGPETTCGTPPCPGNHTNDSIFVSGINNVAFRDIVGNGGRTSRYAVFPVRSNNVLVEVSRVLDIADAGIYVGQSSGIVVRYNDVRGSVAGTELENCGNGQAYGNYATENTGGMLVFLDGSLPVQLSDCHEIHHNLLENNNTTNYGTGSVAGVPDGTGMLVISNDTTPFSYNILRGNNTFGFALVDQEAAGFAKSVVDPTLDYNHVFNNVITGNGLAGDTTPPNDSPVASDLVAIAIDPQTGNCLSDNVTDLAPVLLSFNAPFTTTGCATLPVFPGCPAPPITSSTTTVPTTSTTTTTAGSPSGAFLD
jgi:parallel beta-helix repeat protein